MSKMSLTRLNSVSREMLRGDGEKEAHRNMRYPVRRIYMLLLLLLCDRQRSHCESPGGARSGSPE